MVLAGRRRAIRGKAVDVSDGPSSGEKRSGVRAGRLEGRDGPRLRALSRGMATGLVGRPSQFLSRGRGVGKRASDGGLAIRVQRF